MPTYRDLHVIFGAGQIGSLLAQELLARGRWVRIVRRGPSGASRLGLEWRRGDVLHAGFARAAVEGASVVYNCVNPGDYSRWGKELVPLFTAVRNAATHARARLVVLDNLYMYGPHDGAVREDTPMRPSAFKSELRAQLATELFQAHERGEIIASCGRASDFFGIGTTDMALLGTNAIDRIAHGKTVTVVGDPDLPHAFSYALDVARGLATLGTSEHAWGRAWHLPVAFRGSTRELADRFASALGQKARLRPAPAWLMHVAGIASPKIRAVPEMLYLWQKPFLVDDSAFRARFGVEATPVETAIAETVSAMQAAARAA